MMPSIKNHFASNLSIFFTIHSAFNVAELVGKNPFGIYCALLSFREIHQPYSGPPCLGKDFLTLNF